MKLFKTAFLLAIAAGVFVSCTDNEYNGEKIFDGNYQAGLTAAPGSQKIAKDGTAAVTFTFNLKDAKGVAQNVSKYTATLSIEATGGSVNPTSATTNENGTVTVVFTAPDPKSFTGGTVKGTIKKVQDKTDKDGLFQQGDLATATAQILPLDAENPPVVDEPIKQAEKLKDNTYSIQKKGGDVQVFNLTKECGKWYEGTSWMDGTKQCIQVECMDEDEDYDTKGWLNGEIPLEVANKLTTINQEFYDKYPWAGAKIAPV